MMRTLALLAVMSMPAYAAEADAAAAAPAAAPAATAPAAVAAPAAAEATAAPAASAAPAQSAAPAAARASAAPRAPRAPATLKTDEQKTLYLLGASLGQNIEVFSLKPEEAEFVKMGLDDYIAGKPLRVDAQAYNPKISALAKSRMDAKLAPERKKSAEYAEKAAKEKGAQRTSSGLVIIPIKEGTGASPKASDRVKVHYHGTTTDGKVFDSSVERKEPATFALSGVIPCWTEGVQKLKVGGKAKLVCPSSIAYGDQGMPPRIAGGATLVFEVELLEIVTDAEKK